MKKIPTKATVKVRMVSELVSEKDRFYVRAWPIVDVKTHLTDNDRAAIVEELKKELQKELDK